MKSDFKVNAYFSDDGEELEKLLANYLFLSDIKREKDAWKNKKCEL